jgi:hypothetical protein
MIRIVRMVARAFARAAIMQTALIRGFFSLDPFKKDQVHTTFWAIARLCSTNFRMHWADVNLLRLLGSWGVMVLGI